MFRLHKRWICTLYVLLLSFHSAAGNLLFGVNEGTSSTTDAIFLKAKYAPLVEYLAAASGEKVVLETTNVLPVVARNLERKRYDVLLVRPSHLSARAMRDHGYRLLAVAHGEAKVHFIVRGDSKLKELKDVRGHSIAMPDPLAYPTNVGLALLRDHGVDTAQQKIQYMDRQDAVGLVVQSGLSDVGVVVSYSKAGQEWQTKGGRFLYSREKLPYWSVIVSSKVPPQVVDRLKRALLALDDSSRTRGILGNIGISGFGEGRMKAYLDMLEWVEGVPPDRLAKNM